MKSRIIGPENLKKRDESASTKMDAKKARSGSPVVKKKETGKTASYDQGQKPRKSLEVNFMLRSECKTTLWTELIRTY